MTQWGVTAPTQSVTRQCVFKPSINQKQLTNGMGQIYHTQITIYVKSLICINPDIIDHCALLRQLTETEHQTSGIDPVFVKVL